ncbi:uncharacterized protein [Anabrus simplex]|uniref:uncharacterized protein n=1 Tax=Anabrus simplex TaxID=316456 RepID=UPI0035A35BDE
MCRLVWTLIVVAVTTTLSLQACGSLSNRCRIDDHCAVEHAHCNKGVCACQEGFVPSNHGEDCLPVVSRGGLCNETVQCSGLGERGLCLEQRCSCARGWQWNTTSEDCVPSINSSATTFTKSSAVYLPLAAMVTTLVARRTS